MNKKSLEKRGEEAIINSDISAVQLIGEVKNGYSPLWPFIKYNLAMTREAFSAMVGYHRNSVSLWEKKLTEIPVLYKQYWDGVPRGKYLNWYQIVILSVIAFIKKDYRGHSITKLLRSLALKLEKNMMREIIDVYF